MLSRLFSALVAVCAFLSCASADQVGLRNGDRLSGRIVKSDRESMTMKTEFLGDVTIQWEAIDEITSDQQLFVTSAAGHVLVGVVSTRGDDFIVQISPSSTVPVAKTMVESVRSAEEQASYEAELERLRDPGLLDFWSGSVDAGFSFAEGNADTSTFATSLRTERRTPRDRITVYANSLFAQNNTTGVSETTANAIRGGTRYDIELNGRLFTFGFIDLEFDEFQNLDLRNVLGGGFGWHIITADRITFDFFSGSSFNQEFFSSGLAQRSGEAVFGKELTYKLSESASVSERLAFFPNLNEFGEYRAQFDASLSTQLRDWLAWHVTLSDRFFSNPIPGIKKNDVLLTTGVRFRFGESGQSSRLPRNGE